MKNRQIPLATWPARPVGLPPDLVRLIGPECAVRLVGAGNAALLDEPLLGLIASRECPGHVLLETLERVPTWVQEDRILISGFHSPLEQQVLRSLLRRQGRAIKVLARSLTQYRALPEEREPLAAGRMLILTPFPPATHRVTRKTALERNRLVLALAAERVVPHMTAESPLALMVRSHPTQDDS